MGNGPEQSFDELISDLKCPPKSPKDAEAKGLCALRDAKKYMEIAKLYNFAKNLSEKFYGNLDKGFRTKDLNKLIGLLERDFTNWKELTDKLYKSAKYKIMAAKGEEPAMVIFEYKNGKKEQFSLDFTPQQRKEWKRVAELIEKQQRKEMEDSDNKSQTKNEPKHTDEQILKDLTTREGALMEIKKIAPNLPENLQSELADPLSAFPRAMNILKDVVKDSGTDISRLTDLEKNHYFGSIYMQINQQLRTNFPDHNGGAPEDIKNNVKNLLVKFGLDPLNVFPEPQEASNWNQERLKQLERQTEDRQNMRKREKRNN